MKPCRQQPFGLSASLLLLSSSVALPSLLQQRYESMSDEMTKPILYTFRRCPYAMRARMSLLNSGVEVELREVLL